MKCQFIAVEGLALDIIESISVLGSYLTLHLQIATSLVHWYPAVNNSDFISLQNGKRSLHWESTTIIRAIQWMNNWERIVTSADVEKHILLTCSPFKKCCFILSTAKFLMCENWWMKITVLLHTVLYTYDKFS